MVLIGSVVNLVTVPTEEEEQLTSAPVEPEAETVQEVGSSNESSQDVAADRLNWAKAAYKNIQQKSQQAQETAEETSLGTTDSQIPAVEPAGN